MSKMDDTDEICREFGVMLVRQRGNNYGDAIRTGIEIAKYKHILIMDADGSMEPGDVKRLYDEIKDDDYDIVIGSRYTKGGKTDNPAILIFMSRVVNIFYRLFFNIKVKDVSTSFRIYNAQKLKSLKLVSPDFDIVEEIIILFLDKFKGAAVKEIPVRFRERMKGESKRALLKFAFSYLISILKLYRLKIKNRALNK
jgi:dolichol-phosphate mannosyltransferase